MMRRRGSEQPGLEVAFETDEKPSIQITYERQPATISSIQQRPGNTHLAQEWSPISNGVSPMSQTPPVHSFDTGTFDRYPVVENNTYVEYDVKDPNRGSPGLPPDKADRRICSLRPVTFFLILALVLVIIAAVAGGVSGSAALAQSKSNSESRKSSQTSPSMMIVTVTATAPATAQSDTLPSTSSTNPKATSTSSLATSTASGLISVPTTGTLPLSCPSETSKQTQITLKGEVWNFKATCGTDYLPTSTIPTVDIAGFVAYTLQDCARACAVYNRNYGQDVCKAVVFNSDLTTSVQTSFATCYLKNSTAGEAKSGDSKYVGLLLV